MSEEYKVDFQVSKRPDIDEQHLNAFWKQPVSQENGLADSRYGLTFLCHKADGVDHQNPATKEIPSIDDEWQHRNYFEVHIRENFDSGATANCGVLSTPEEADLDGNGKLTIIAAAAEWSHLDFSYDYGVQLSPIGSVGSVSTVIRKKSISFTPDISEPPISVLIRPQTYQHGLMPFGGRVKTGAAGGNVQYAFYVENQGFVTDSYDLTVQADLPISGLTSRITVAPGGKAMGDVCCQCACGYARGGNAFNHGDRHQCGQTQ